MPLYSEHYRKDVVVLAFREPQRGRDYWLKEKTSHYI